MALKEGGVEDTEDVRRLRVLGGGVVRVPRVDEKWTRLGAKLACDLGLAAFCLVWVRVALGDEALDRDTCRRWNGEVIQQIWP